MEGVIDAQTYLNAESQGFHSACDPEGTCGILAVSKYSVENMPEFFAISLDNSDSMAADTVGEEIDITNEGKPIITPAANPSKYLKPIEILQNDSISQST